MDSEDRVKRDQMLRRAVLAGDEHAWRILYYETFDDLRQYVQWRCGQRPDWTDEIVQETWLTAVRRMRRFDPRRGGFAAWLRGIAANVLRSHIRRRARLLKRELAVGLRNGQDAAADAPPPDQPQGERIAAALNALPERQEAVLRAKYLDSLSVAEIAALWNETPKAVESLLGRARQAFRDAYRKQGDEYAEPT